MNKNLSPGQYYGAVPRRLNLGGAILSEVVHTVPRQIPAHVHARPYFTLILQGAYRERAAGFALEYAPFTLVYHSSGFEHDDEIGFGGVRMFAVELPGDPPGGVRKVAGADHMGGEAVWAATALYRAFRDPDAPGIAIESHLAELSARVVRLPGLGDRLAPRWLARVSDRIHSDFRQGLRLDDLAREAGVHPVHLSRTFARRAGTGLHEHIERVRLRWVCGEMASGEFDLAALAAEAGYADQSHMTRAFRRITGMTPGAVRLALRTSPSLANVFGVAVPA